MQPRLAFRTHYQVDEPAYLGILVNQASSATRSDYPERVAERLAKAVQRRPMQFNIAAAGYAVDLGRRLGVINDQQVWTPLGHLVHLFAKERGPAFEFALDELEQLLYFRVFLEGDGAALLFLSQYLSEHGAIPVGTDSDWNAVARELFLWSYEEYLKLSSTTVERLSLRRELDRLRRDPYKGKTGNHKLFIHLQTMYRIGLVEEQNGSGRRRYVGRPDAISQLLSKVDSVVTLEAIIREQKWPEVVTCIRPGASSGTLSAATVRRNVAERYEEIMGTGVALCPISTLLDAVTIDHIARKVVLDQRELQQWLVATGRSAAKEVRFHVDRAGNPAFVRIEPSILTEWSN